MYNKIINALRIVVARHDDKTKAKHGYVQCDRPETRNRYKLDKYKTKATEPSCVIFKDDRCCGGCSLLATCDHAVDCNCQRFRIAAVGSFTDYYLKKASPQGKYGRMKDETTFDWEYYKEQTNKNT